MSPLSFNDLIVSTFNLRVPLINAMCAESVTVKSPVTILPVTILAELSNLNVPVASL